MLLDVRVLGGCEFGLGSGEAHDECVAHRLVVTVDESVDEVREPLDVSGLEGVLGEPNDERVGVPLSAFGLRVGFGHSVTVVRLRIIGFGLSEVGASDPDGLTVRALDAAPPFEAVSNPVVQLADGRPGGGVDGDPTAYGVG